MSSPGDLPPEQAARVVAAMRDLIATRFRTNAALGRELKRSGAAIGAMLAANPKHGPSLETARRVAKLMGSRVEDLLHGTAPSPAAQLDPYPERSAALSRLVGLVPPEVEARLRSVLVHDERRLTELDWLELTVMRIREHERANALESSLTTETSRLGSKT